MQSKLKINQSYYSILEILVSNSTPLIYELTRKPSVVLQPRNCMWIKHTEYLGSYIFPEHVKFSPKWLLTADKMETSKSYNVYYNQYFISPHWNLQPWECGFSWSSQGQSQSLKSPQQYSTEFLHAHHLAPRSETPQPYCVSLPAIMNKMDRLVTDKPSAFNCFHLLFPRQIQERFSLCALFWHPKYQRLTWCSLFSSEIETSLRPFQSEPFWQRHQVPAGGIMLQQQFLTSGPDKPNYQVREE